MRSLPVMPRTATSATVRSQLCFIYFNTVVTDIIQTAFSPRLPPANGKRLGPKPRSPANGRSHPIRAARVDTRPGGPTLASVPRGAPVKELRDPPDRYRGDPLNLIRVMPAKGQDMTTVASPRISLFLARRGGPIVVAVAIGVLANGAVYRSLSEEFVRSPVLIYITGIMGMSVGVAILLNHNVWAADWRVLITIFGWLAAIGGAQRIIWPQGTEAAIR